MTREETKLLQRLASGEMDGIVGDDLITSGGSRVWMAIKDGVPKQLKQGPGKKFFNGKENEYIEGKLHTLQKWCTDSEKIQFLRKYGFLMNAPEARNYSAKFKTKK